jgi:hypothetical protein
MIKPIRTNIYFENGLKKAPLGLGICIYRHKCHMSLFLVTNDTSDKI